MFFCNIPKEIEKKLIPPNKDFSDYLKEPVNNTFYICPTNARKVEQKLKTLKTNKAVGTNSIPTKILKTYSKSLSKPLSELINLSFALGKFPTILKIAKVIPNLVSHLNINPPRLKFDSLAQKITGNVNILMVSETKLDNSSPEGQFLIEGYRKPYRIDRNCHRGGILLYVRADISSKLLPTELLPMEGQINVQKKKWLLCCSYNPNENTIKSHIEILHKGLALYSSKYENFIILGDFNVGMNNSDMTVFCDTYGLKCLIKEPTCYTILKIHPA